MKKKAVLAKLAVEGIQKYIFSTGKLKEMIGASEIIHYLGEEDFYKRFLQGMRAVSGPDFSGVSGEFIVAQANAGSLCIIFGQMEDARSFMENFSRELLKKFPGLPFYGACEAFDWSEDAEGVKAYRACREVVDRKIEAARNFFRAPDGCGLLPILRAARLDGLPAAGKDGETPVSLPSLARCNPEMIDKSRKRLRDLVHAPLGLRLEWKDNLEDLLAGKDGKIALICMDGNSMGKLFGDRLEKAFCSISANMQEMRELSRNVERLNNAAFAWACEKLVSALANDPACRDAQGNFVMPLRPIVMGGDDVTVICRAEVALAFVSLFTARLEKLGAGEKLALSIGAGMVVMDSSYPFVKAFPLAESLQDSAKNLTKDMLPRPSSLDYLVLTEEVEDNLESLRYRLFRSAGGEVLTSKPFILHDGQFADFLDKGLMVNSGLPRSQIREAWTLSRLGSARTVRAWENLKENIARNLGGRGGKLLSPEQFNAIFPENFFIRRQGESEWISPLGDYLELAHLLPANSGTMLDLIRGAAANA